MTDISVQLVLSNRPSVYKVPKAVCCLLQSAEPMGPLHFESTSLRPLGGKTVGNIIYNLYRHLTKHLFNRVSQEWMTETHRMYFLKGCILVVKYIFHNHCHTGIGKIWHRSTDDELESTMMRVKTAAQFYSMTVMSDVSSLFWSRYMSSLLIVYIPKELSTNDRETEGCVGPRRRQE